MEHGFIYVLNECCRFVETDKKGEHLQIGRLCKLLNEASSERGSGRLYQLAGWGFSVEEKLKEI